MCDTNEKAFDRVELLARLEGDEGLMLEIMAVFLEDTPNQLWKLQKACEAGNVTAIAEHAHTLKGVAANMGAATVMDMAYRVEQLGRAGDAAAAADILPELDTAMALLVAKVRECSPDLP